MRYPALLTAAILAFLLCVPQVMAGKREDSELVSKISARAAVVIDVNTDRILFEKKAQQRMRIASLTKIMTAIVAIENADLKETVTVSPRAVGVEGSSIYLKEGEKIPLEHLLYGLMLRSGNDAATAIAEHVGGSLPGFVYLMNEKAHYLGLDDTHFKNPHGLDAPNHYSTAEDMARLTAYALRNPAFKKIVSTPVKTVPWPGEEWHRKWYNKNKMLRLYPGADGVKTGYTKLSKRTLVSSATREGRQLATVTLNASNDWNDSMHLLEYGFVHYRPVELIQKGEEMSDVPVSKKLSLSVTAEKSFTYPLTEEERKEVTVKPILTYPLSKIDKEGMRVGMARVYLKGEVVGSVPLVTRTNSASVSSVFTDWMTVITYVLGKEG
ncbi:D-alanyl-D-alanine carboxypeptidase family protein [Salinithrix halophila]|uniref:serine-type D-Ala-D-Ala carboxypeptidase n=1 Tax=Salinithrix halophila TaxID=1485204 RepID=A0ABV8JHY1_9BACL